MSKGSFGHIVPLFAGYALPKEVAGRLHEWSNVHLAPLGVRVIPAENLHITTLFFGEVEDRIANWLKRVVNAYAPELIEVRSTGLRMVGRGAIAVLLDRTAPSIDTSEPPASFEPSSYVEVMRQPLEGLLTIDPASIPREERVVLLWRAAMLCCPTRGRRGHGHFHVTVARCRDKPSGLSDIKYPNLAFGLTDFHLYESELGPGGSLYSILATARG
ncbi:MAG: RNA 2',3'-cyclic phosphodiesterase [Fimbriimonadaceae bacterium]|nr:RNA 2',3'-cyclic phosphodiesterase [Fimbriimonadaceae bacterium]